VNQQMKQLIIKTIYNFKFHLIAEMMLYILVQYGWDLQFLNQLELYLIQDLNISQLLQFYVMMRQLETINLRNTTHFKEDSYKETKPTEDAKPWPMTCTNLTQTKFCQRQVQNLPMAQLNFRASSGKTTPASNL